MCKVPIGHMRMSGVLSAEDLHSESVAVFVEDCNVLPSLRFHRECKEEHGLAAHVIFVLPKLLEDQYLALTHGMQFMGVLHGSQLDGSSRKYSVFHDAPAVKPGVLPAALLPPALQKLRTPVHAVGKDETDLTFVLLPLCFSLL